MDRLFTNNQNTSGVYGNPQEDFETAKAGLAGFFGTPDTSSVMNPNAKDAYQNAELANLFSNLIPGKAPLAVGAGGILKMYKTLPQALKDSLMRGATKREMFDNHNAVWDGKDWYQFFKDDIKVPPKGFEGTTNVKSSTNNLFPSIGNTPITYRKFPSTSWGRAGVDRNTGKNFVEINQGLSPVSKAETVGHEIQHIYDPIQGRTAGTTKTATSEADVKELKDLLSAKYKHPEFDYTPFDHYQHQRGEVRARLNALLNNDPDHYQGLESVFKKGQFYPEMLWEK